MALGDPSWLGFRSPTWLCLRVGRCSATEASSLITPGSLVKAPIA